MHFNFIYSDVWAAQTSINQSNGVKGVQTGKHTEDYELWGTYLGLMFVVFQGPLSK